jgi:sugar (pentulose or hexulose) kinase
MAKYVIGVDGGTESLRAGVFDATGRPLAFAASPYPTAYPHPSWAEQDPDHWWAALGNAVREAVAQSGVKPTDIAALSVDTTCCTVVALDASGRHLRPALLWMDMRSAVQAGEVAACGAPELRVNGGGAGPVSAEWMVPKARWLKQRERGVYDAAHWICEYQVSRLGGGLCGVGLVIGLCHLAVGLLSEVAHCQLAPMCDTTATIPSPPKQDYLNYHLTGEMVASVNNVAIRWHASDGWPEELLARLDMAELRGKWPQRVVKLGERIGNGLTER